MVTPYFLVRTVGEFINEWDILYEKGEFADYDTYRKWRSYLLEEIAIPDFAGDSTDDMNNARMSHYAYLRLWGFVGSSIPDYYVVDKYGIYGYLSRYTLTTTVIPVSSKNWVELQPPGGSYDPGSSIALSAKEVQGYKFSHWSGDLSGNENPVWVTLNDDKVIVANFVEVAAGLNLMNLVNSIFMVGIMGIFAKAVR